MGYKSVHTGTGVVPNQYPQHGCPEDWKRGTDTGPATGPTARI